MNKTEQKPPLERITCITYPTKGAMGRTGDWRIFRPVVNLDKCTGCRLCWLYCPEAAITMDKEGKPEIDLEYCKGCMICAEECPVQAIDRIRETEANE